MQAAEKQKQAAAMPGITPQTDSNESSRSVEERNQEQGESPT